MTTRKKKVFAVAIFGAATLGVVIWYYFFHLGFDPVSWKDEAKIRQGVRLRMADALVARSTLSGMSRTQVVELLGEPSKAGYFKEWDLVYWLGPQRGFVAIDSEWLVIRLDANNRVSEYRISVD